MPQPSAARSAVTRSLIHRLTPNRQVAEWPRRWRTAAAALLAAVNRPLHEGSGVQAGASPAIGAPTHIRVMRWAFCRGDASVTCELKLAENASGYEFTTRRSTDSSVSIEWFGHITKVFQRQSEFEGELLRDGWSLESYESLTIEPPSEE